MDEQETIELEQNINTVEMIIVTLQKQRNNISYQIADLKRVLEKLVKLLPPEKQAEHRRNFPPSHQANSTMPEPFF